MGHSTPLHDLLISYDTIHIETPGVGVPLARNLLAATHDLRSCQQHASGAHPGLFTGCMRRQVGPGRLSGRVIVDLIGTKLGAICAIVRIEPGCEAAETFVQWHLHAQIPFTLKSGRMSCTVQLGLPPF